MSPRRSTGSSPGISSRRANWSAATAPTKLATIVQLDPIYVTFNVSEQDALKVRENLRQRRLTLAEIDKVPIEVGLMDEDGLPAQGLS